MTEYVKHPWPRGIKSLAEILRDRRKELGIGYYRASKLCTLSKKTYSYYECGKFKSPTFTTLLSMADGLKLVFLIGPEGSMRVRYLPFKERKKYLKNYRVHKTIRQRKEARKHERESRSISEHSGIGSGGELGQSTAQLLEVAATT